MVENEKEYLGEIKAFTSPEDAVSAGYDVSLTKEEAALLARMTPEKRLEWLKQREKFYSSLKKYVKNIEKSTTKKIKKKNKRPSFISKRSLGNSTFCESVKSKFKKR